MTTCPSTGKRCLTRAQAQREALWWRRERFARMNHYRCRSCGFSHVGNATAKPRRRAA